MVLMVKLQRNRDQNRYHFFNNADMNEIFEVINLKKKKIGRKKFGFNRKCPII